MKCIIIDDEPHCCNVIARLLEKYVPDASVQAICADGIAGLEAIRQFSPDLIFLDIEMPKMNGFQMLEAIDFNQYSFAVIFTTAYDKFAIKAFKYSALDYLLKPIDEDELVHAVRKLSSSSYRKEQMNIFRNTYFQNNFNKLTVASLKGIRFLDLDEIIAIEADSNYSKFYLLNSESILASKTLGYFEDILAERGFFRTHKQFMINLKHLKEYIGGDWNVIVMANNIQAKLARTKREEFLRLFS